MNETSFTQSKYIIHHLSRTAIVWKKAGNGAYYLIKDRNFLGRMTISGTDGRI
jgi:hypothetical protein